MHRDLAAPPSDALVTSAREADFVHGRDGRARKGKTVSVCLHCGGCLSLPDDPFVFELRVRTKVRQEGADTQAGRLQVIVNLGTVLVA